MNHLLEKLRKWVLSQAVTLLVVLLLSLFYFFNMSFFKLDPLLTLTLSVLALVASQNLSNTRDKLIVAISLLLIALLPILQATMALALLVGLVYLLEDEANSLYFFALLILCLIESLPGFNDQIGETRIYLDLYRALQLSVLYCIAVKGVRSERAFIFILLALSSSLSKPNGEMLTLPLLSLLTFLSCFKFGLNRSLMALGLSLSVYTQNIGLALISLAMVLAHAYLEVKTFKTDLKLLVPLFFVLALFEIAPFYAAIILFILIMRVLITSGMKVCLSKSHL